MGMFRVLFPMMLGLLLLAGCSPDYNWRQVRVADGAVTAFFPDKPRTESRGMQFDGHDLAFSLTSVSVHDTLFAVGYAPLPQAIQGDPAAREAFASAVIGSLYQGMGERPPPALPAWGEPFVIEGNTQAATLRLKVVVWLTDRALVEGVVTAKASAFPQAQADEFLRGINGAGAAAPRAGQP